MEKNPEEPIAQIIAKLEEMKDMPDGPERAKKFKEEVEVLFIPAAEELSLLGDAMRVYAERNQNGETLKSFMKNAGVDTPVIRLVQTQSKSKTWFKSSVESVKDFWDRKKGGLAVGMIFVAALFFYANQRNIKIIQDFTHENDLVGLFEDWMETEEEMRETPVNWRELEEEGENV